MADNQRPAPYLNAMTSDPLSGLTAPTLADIERLADEAFARLPEAF